MLKPAGTEKDSSAGYRMPVQARRWEPQDPKGQTGLHSTPRSDERPKALLEAELSDSMLPRKAAGRVIRPTVPETDTGRQGEHPKARERTLVKELGKLTP